MTTEKVNIKKINALSTSIQSNVSIVKNVIDGTITEYEIDELANKTPEYNDNKFRAFKSGIQTIGQIQPILLRNGKIVDGRHRYKACKELGIEPIVKELGNISDAEVLKYVKALTVAKDKTATQLAIEAYNFYIEEKAAGIKTTYKKIAHDLGVGIKSMKRVKYIKKVRPEFIEPLFKGHSVVVKDIANKREQPLAALYTIEEILKRNASMGNVEVIPKIEERLEEYPVDWQILFETKEAFDWFMDLTSEDHIQHYNTSWWSLAELANIKYPSNVEDTDCDNITSKDYNSILDISSKIPDTLDKEKVINWIKIATAKRNTKIGL